MQVLVQRPIPARTNPRLTIDATKPFWLRILDTIAAWDARKRAEHQLRNMEQFRLDDMGISQADIDRAFR